MKEKKYRELNLYSYYDHAGIARHLEDMARQGWQLEKAGGTFFTYRRCDPAELHYAVVYFAKASQFDPEPPAEQQEFWELCKTTGWELVTSRYQMQIFCNPAKDPTPIETDPVVQVENVRTAMKKGAVRGNWALLICSCLQIWLQFRTYSIRDFLTQAFALSAVLIWLLLGINAIVELTAYYRWYRKAKAAAREEGVLLSPRSRRWWQILRIMFLVVIITIDLLILLLDTSLRPSTHMVIWVSLFCYIALMLIIYGSRQLMKKKGFSAEANMGLNILIAIAGTFVLIGGVIWVSFRLADDPSLNGHQNAETISYTRGYRTYTYDFYRDPIPLSIEDLTGAELDPDYSRQMDVRGTPLLTKYDIRQCYPIGSPAYAARRGLRLEYTIWEVGTGFLYEPVKNSFFKDTVFTVHGQIDFVIPHGWVSTDAAPWGALDAYQYHDEDGQSYASYLLCYADRFVVITFDTWYTESPTAEQMALVGEALGSGPLS